VAGQESTRVKLIGALGELGPFNKLHLVAVLGGLLLDESESVREAALGALAKIPPYSPDDVAN